MKTAEEIAYKYEITDGDGCGTDCVFIDDTIKAMEEYASVRVAEIVTGNIAFKMIDNTEDIVKKLKKLCVPPYDLQEKQLIKYAEEYDKLHYNSMPTALLFVNEYLNRNA